MVNFKTTYMEFQINTDDAPIGEDYKGYMAVSPNNTDESKFFTECYESQIMCKAKGLFPSGDISNEDWTILINIQKDNDKVEFLELIEYVKYLEAEFLEKVKNKFV